MFGYTSHCENAFFMILQFIRKEAGDKILCSLIKLIVTGRSIDEYMKYIRFCSANADTLRS